MKGGGAAPSHGPCFSLPCLTQPWAPKSARASHWYPREACRMSSVPCLRQGLRNPRVPSILTSDRGPGPPVCPASSPQTGARDHPCAQHPRLRQGLGTLRVPSILASDRGQGPLMCPASSPQTGAQDPRVPSIMCPRQGPRNPVCPASCAPDRRL